MLRIGNLYGHGFDPGQLGRLEALGFAFRPAVSTYMGSQVCHFVDFPTGPSLELIEVTDRSDYESFVPAGMEPYCPGISMVVEEGSPGALDGYAHAFADLEPYRLRVAYRNGSGPGWHYLNFGVPVVSGAFVWLTAFDAPLPISERRTRHPNGVQGVVGLVFDLDPAGLDCLQRLAGQPTGEGGLSIGGVTVMAADTGGSLGRFSLRAVVLRADSLSAFGALVESAEATRLLGRPTLVLETNPLCWDVWITD